MAIWSIRKEPADIGLMSETINVSPIMAQVMVNRGIRTKNTAIKYLYPQIDFLHDTNTMKDFSKAVRLITEQALLRKKIAIYGDYDVDGIISTSILYKTLKSFGANVIYYIPHREKEGYGLNISAIDKLIGVGVDFIITCDNGITSIDEVTYAKEKGLTVVIMDHHEPTFSDDGQGNVTEILPPADAVIDPKQRLCEYPFKMLCAGGIAFKFALEFHKSNGLAFDLHNELLTLAMLPTFCDVVDLLDENRVIAKNGLDILNKNKQINLGLYELLKVRGYGEKSINSFCVGFIIGPCINASGRLLLAEIGVELFTTDNAERASYLAAMLADLNEERKYLTSVSTENALSQLENSELKPVIVIYDCDMHESIAGIVAGRLKERMYRPVVVLTDCNEGGEAKEGSNTVKGSARSIEGYNIFEELCKLKHLLVRFGGHPMAAGLTMKKENIDEFIRLINENCLLTDEELIEKVWLDGELTLSQVTYKLAEELKRLEPFGKANKQPLFVTKGLEITELKVIKEKHTVIFTFLDDISGKKTKGISFDMVDLLYNRLLDIYPELECDKIMCGVLRNVDLCIDVVYSIDINEYNNDVSVQLRIKDFNLYQAL